ncbi:MAG: metallophosphoesterase [Bacteroidales bacterium]|nr:metallophosphoesterase [Bacteroidales bacterium]
MDFRTIFVTALTLSLCLACDKLGKSGESGSDVDPEPPAVTVEPFRIAVVGDIQAPDQKAYEMAREVILDDLGKRKDIEAAFFLGDLSMENSEVLEKSAKLFKSWSFPVYAVPGNHDRDGELMGKRSLDTWKRNFGTPDTTFVLKGVRFILMNNVRTGTEVQGKDYAGGFTEPQKMWLDKTIHTEFDGRTFFLSHIAVSSCKGKDTLATIFSGVGPLMLLNAHTHMVSRSSWQGYETFDAGAPYAYKWKSDKGAELMSCGAPRGYFIFTVDPEAEGDDYLKIEFLSAIEEYPAPAYACVDSSGKLIVNVYAGAEDGSITADGRKMSYKKMPDPRISSRDKDSKHIWILKNSGNKAGDSVVLEYSDKHYNFTKTLTVK